MRFRPAPFACFFCLILTALTSAASAQDARRYEATPDRRVAFQIDRTRDPVYPARLRNEGYLEGKAAFAISVNHLGELEDYLLLEATHIEFARAVEKVLPLWEYGVPRINGEPAAVVSSVQVRFDRTGVVVYETSGITLNPFAGGSSDYRIYGLWELDALPEPVHIEKPEFHVDLLENRELATAVYEFYIDAEGKVRMPTLREADDQIDERLLLIAQESLLQWRFDPPRVKGKPVVTRAAQPFRFKRTTLDLAAE